MVLAGTSLWVLATGVSRERVEEAWERPSCVFERLSGENNKQQGHERQVRSDKMMMMKTYSVV